MTAQAILREARLREVTPRDISDSIDFFQFMDTDNETEISNYEIKWINGNRMYHHTGYWLISENGAGIGVLMMCTKCGHIFESLGGNYVDDMENCINCGIRFGNQ